MSSMSYWNVASTVQSQLGDLKAAGDEMHGNLEASDDPAELADALDAIEKRMSKLVADIKANVPPIRKVGKAMADVPGIR